MITKKQIPNNDWRERLLVFSYGNQGRISAIASEGLTILENMRFRNVKYDPHRKGNDLIITLYDGIETFRHKVNDPSEIFIHENKEGKAFMLEIVDQKSNPTYIRLFQ